MNKKIGYDKVQTFLRTSSLTVLKQSILNMERNDLSSEMPVK